MIVNFGVGVLVLIAVVEGVGGTAGNDTVEGGGGAIVVYCPARFDGAHVGVAGSLGSTGPAVGTVAAVTLTTFEPLITKI